MIFATIFPIFKIVSKAQGLEKIRLYSKELVKRKCWLPALYKQTCFYVPGAQVFWYLCGNRRSCSLHTIFPFTIAFSTLLENFPSFSSNLELSSAPSLSYFGEKVKKLLQFVTSNCPVSLDIFKASNSTKYIYIII